MFSSLLKEYKEYQKKLKHKAEIADCGKRIAKEVPTQFRYPLSAIRYFCFALIQPLG
jgi:hypothetical protein